MLAAQFLHQNMSVLGDLSLPHQGALPSQPHQRSVPPGEPESLASPSPTSTPNPHLQLPHKNIYISSGVSHSGVSSSRGVSHSGVS